MNFKQDEEHRDGVCREVEHAHGDSQACDDAHEAHAQLAQVVEEGHSGRSDRHCYSPFLSETAGAS